MSSLERPVSPHEEFEQKPLEFVSPLAKAEVSMLGSVLLKPSEEKGKKRHTKPAAVSKENPKNAGEEGVEPGIKKLSPRARKLILAFAAASIFSGGMTVGKNTAEASEGYGANGSGYYEVHPMKPPEFDASARAREQAYRAQQEELYQQQQWNLARQAQEEELMWRRARAGGYGGGQGSYGSARGQQGYPGDYGVYPQGPSIEGVIGSVLGGLIGEVIAKKRMENRRGNRGY